jgi:hypothetical protein
MLQVHFRRVRPDRVDDLKEWLTELQRRADEVRESFRQEGVRHEQAFLLETRDGPLLVYAIEVQDPEAAQQAYERSMLSIDHEHRVRMTEAISGAADMQPLYDVRL